MTQYDVAVVGAGVFGTWTACMLQRAGKRVLLIDSYGAGNSRSSSGDESRIIRMGYGGDTLYTHLSHRALTLWKDLFAYERQSLFVETGVLWMLHEGDARVAATEDTLTDIGWPYERLSQSQSIRRYPQISWEELDGSLFEPSSGALLARRSVQLVQQHARTQGIEILASAILPPKVEHGELASITTNSGESIRAKQFVFACGAWMPKLFPDTLGGRIFPTRQNVFYFGTPAGSHRYTVPALPIWLDIGDIYGFPDIESRGFKIGMDAHGPALDPDVEDRLIRTSDLTSMRLRMAGRFPELADAPLIESRTCIYENTSNGDLLADRHPLAENVYFLGGGSGHGFKHGPAIAEYMVSLLAGTTPPEDRFSCASKGTEQARVIF